MYNTKTKIILNIITDYGTDKLVFDYIEEIKETFLLKYPAGKWGEKALKAIKNGKIFIGMTKDQARSSWGPPIEINRSGGSWGIHEQWVYGGNRNYLYFENEKLSSWQN